ncbi:SLC13 family permease [Fuchsiella alkaliacetigena]|uniref:SLC13 family permease n=1 Tax=Fuchsiella alkaliacetigena TaxID=957042 RepID=UPI002009E28A|nr:DASS family sodium-coupled anion symporter [Fuchsiella alkaliacetigena]MCK8825580.1 DASS family sodium-coupled anion symporter [Fuchsiella alkaliacetigena]
MANKAQIAEVSEEEETELAESKRGFWLLIALLVGIAVWLLPRPSGLAVQGHKYLALLAALIVLFVTEAFPLPVVMGGAGGALILFEIGELEQVWTSYAHPVVFFVLGCLMLANIAEKVGLTKRLSNILLRYCGTNVVRFSFFSSLILGVASALMHDVSAATLGLMSIVPLMREAGIKPGSDTGKFMVIALAFSCSVGGMGTLVGGGRNMVAVAFLAEFTGIQISFWEWFLHAMLPAVVTIPIVWGAVYLVFRPDTSISFSRDSLEESIAGSLSGEEKKTLLVIALVFIGFLTKEFHQLDYSVIVIFAVCLLVALGLVDWEYLNKRTAWAVSFLVFGGGISLGRAMDYTGTAAYLAELFFPIFEGGNWFVLFVGVGIFASLLTQLMANVASAALIMPIAVPMAQMMGIDPSIIALSLGMFTSFAYLMVIGCPPNVVAYSVGYFKASDLLKAGLLAQPAGIAFLSLVATLWWRILGIII